MTDQEIFDKLHDKNRTDNFSVVAQGLVSATIQLRMYFVKRTSIDDLKVNLNQIETYSKWLRDIIERARN